ncbi:hypothetical protein D1007_62000 [Hordeum vulgare]|nr:hypothetical protein D1007_62000 [Hordeum vulgare]
MERPVQRRPWSFTFVGGSCSLASNQGHHPCHSQPASSQHHPPSRFPSPASESDGRWTLNPDKLERSELQAEMMQEEMAAIKMKAEEYEAACDKELELLRKRSPEQEEKLAHLMALFGPKAS